MATMAFSQGLYAQETLAPTPAAQSQPAVGSPVKNFKVPAQPLGSALLEIAQQGEVKINVAADLVAGKNAPAVSGSYTLEEAFRQALVGTGLQVVKKEKRGLTVFGEDL